MRNKAALYLRLSRDDGSANESESISNQRAFLVAYAEKNSMEIVDIIADDGFSGINFNRPGFQHLIELIEDKKIDIVLTKDLSRLGRDYIQTGYYIEQYFPLHNIRFIAVNDNIDSDVQNNNSDMTPFRAVFNDMYAKDISKKVRTALDTKKQQGKFIGSNAPFGYKKDPQCKGHLLIDEDAAEYVRQIFKDFLAGETILGIAHKFTAKGIPTPSEYKKLTATQKFCKGLWNDAMIKNILTNPTYIGNLTQNRSRKISYKVNKKIRLPQKEWVIVEGTHEPIISEEDFKAVSQLLSKRSYNKKKRSGEAHLLSGMVFCKDCGGGMTFVRESPTRTYLVCNRWRKNAKLGICTSHCIREDIVENKIRETLKELASALNVSEILTEAGVFFDKENRDEKLVSTIEKKIEGCKAVALSLYKDKVSGLITEDEYREMSEGLQNERAVFEERLKDLYDEQRQRSQTKNMAEILSSIICFDKIDRNTLVLLVEKIYIEKDKDIEIIFKFDNPMSKNEQCDEPTS